MPDLPRLTDGFRVEWAAETSRPSEVVLCQRLADGTIERTPMTMFWAHVWMPIDPRNGTEVVAAWIDPKGQLDSGWTVSI